MEKADLKIAKAVGLDRRSRSGRAVSRFAELGDQPPLVTLSLCIAAAGAIGRNERLWRTGLRMLAAHSLTTIAKSIGKGVIDRTRPEDALHNGRYRMEEGDSRQGRLRSMPSGHSAGSMALAVAAVQDYPAAAAPAAGAAAAVLFSQIPAKNHFASDVIAGALIGAFAAGTASVLIPRYDRIRLGRSPPR